MNEPNLLEPIAVSIPVGCNFIGVARSSMYKLINAKEVETVTIGRRRLLILESLKRCVASKIEGAE